MKRLTIYLAGPLFGIADRHHNLRLAVELKRLGYQVILPQEEATKFLKDGKLDLDAVVASCAKQASQSDVVVANIDGPDADSGTSLEVGIALREKLGIGSGDKVQNLSGGIKPLVICLRTDFRTAPDQEVGINGMFRLADKIIYKPAYVNSFREAADFYKELAQEIGATIRSLFLGKQT